MQVLRTHLLRTSPVPFIAKHLRKKNATLDNKLARLTRQFEEAKAAIARQRRELQLQNEVSLRTGEAGPVGRGLKFVLDEKDAALTSDEERSDGLVTSDALTSFLPAIGTLSDAAMAADLQMEEYEVVERHRFTSTNDGDAVASLMHNSESSAFSAYKRDRKGKKRAVWGSPQLSPERQVKPYYAPDDDVEFPDLYNILIRHGNVPRKAGSSSKSFDSAESKETRHIRPLPRRRQRNTNCSGLSGAMNRLHADPVKEDDVIVITDSDDDAPQVKKRRMDWS